MLESPVHLLFPIVNVGSLLFMPLPVLLLFVLLISMLLGVAADLDHIQREVLRACHFRNHLVVDVLCV